MAVGPLVFELGLYYGGVFKAAETAVGPRMFYAHDIIEHPVQAAPKPLRKPLVLSDRLHDTVQAE